jgi:hypothetical protein
MTTQLSVNNIQPETVASISGPRIANIQVSNSSYVATGANTLSTSGGFVIINGSGFHPNVNVVVGNVLATSVTYVSTTRINSQIPPLSLGSYFVYVTTTDNGKVAIRPNGITTA